MFKKFCPLHWTATLNFPNLTAVSQSGTLETPTYQFFQNFARHIGFAIFANPDHFRTQANY